MFRTILKNMLSALSKWALRKHKIKLFVVSGWYGTELSRELAYQVLGSQLVVRRMVKNPWWDLSIPLAILGYKDKKHNPIVWMLLLAKISIKLLIGKPNPHILILNINYSDAATAQYWAKFVRPSMLLITSFKESLPFLQKVIKVTKDAGGYIVFNIKDQEQLGKIIGNYDKIFSFGKDAGDLHFHELDTNTLIFDFEKQTYKVKKGFMPGVKTEMLAGCVSLALLNKIAIVDALYALVKFQMPNRMLERIKLNLKS